MAGKTDDGATPNSNPSGAPRNNPLARLRDLVGADLPSQPEAERVDEPARATPKSNERVVVRRERSGRGGKAATIVEGEGLHGRDLEQLAKDAARALGCGARIEGGALVVQGDQPERVERWLRSQRFASITRGN